MRQRGYTKQWPLAEALLCIYEAKKAAEAAEGVGRRSDIAVIRKDRDTVILSDKILSAIDPIVDGQRRMSVDDADRQRVLDVLDPST